MSLFLPTIATVSSQPARQRIAAASFALAAILAGLLAVAGPARAQNGPLSLAVPATTPGGVRSADPGMADAEKAAAQKKYGEAIDRFDRVRLDRPLLLLERLRLESLLPLLLLECCLLLLLHPERLLERLRRFSSTAASAPSPPFSKLRSR